MTSANQGHTKGKKSSPACGSSGHGKDSEKASEDGSRTVQVHKMVKSGQGQFEVKTKVMTQQGWCKGMACGVEVMSSAQQQ